MVPTVSETKSFNDRLNRLSRQTAGVPPFRSSFLPQFLYVAFGLRLSFRRVSFRQQTYSGKHAYLNFADEEVLRFPCSASSANEKRSKSPTNTPKITFPRGDTSCHPQGLRSASQPAERRVPPLILHKAPLLRVTSTGLWGRLWGH